jgi:hypothetical protein
VCGFLCEGKLPLQTKPHTAKIRPKKSASFLKKFWGKKKKNKKKNMVRKRAVACIIGMKSFIVVLYFLSSGTAATTSLAPFSSAVSENPTTHEMGAGAPLSGHQFFDRLGAICPSVRGEILCDISAPLLKCFFLLWGNREKLFQV